jgi:hypothetical protein
MSIARNSCARGQCLGTNSTSLSDTRPKNWGLAVRKMKLMAITGLIAASLTSVGAADASSRKIVLLKETQLVLGNATRAHAIVRTPDGGFVVTGSILIDTSENKLWATRVTSSGEVVWNYGMRTEADKDFKGTKGTFVGALMLSDNSTLLCGSKTADESGGPTVGYLLHVDAAGKVLDQSSFYPNGDTRFGLSNIRGCFPWGDGFALVGATTHGRQSAGWLIKLDGRGLKEWEKVGPDIGSFDAVETADHDLVTLDRGPRQFTTTLRRFDSRGQLIASRDIDGLANALMRSIGATTNAYCVTSAFPSGHQTMRTLDRDLHDGSPERPIGKVVVGSIEGRGFVYPDQSLAIFGQGDGGGGSGIAAITYMSPNSKLQAEYKFRGGEGSIWVNDAVTLQSDTEFATIREWAVSQEKRGIILDWVSIR